MKKTIYRILFFLTPAMIFIIMAQTSWHPFEMKPLKNDKKNTETPQFNFESYKDNSFQKAVEDYLRDNYGFREFGTRLYNQYRYSFYKITCNNFFTPGKDHWMFYFPGVKDYYGLEFYSHFKTNEELTEYIDSQVNMLNELRSILKNDYGIELLSFIAPDKPFIYPQYLPEMEKDSTTLNAADYFTKRFEETGFPNINLIPWYKEIADTSSRNLFMPMDSHWTFAAVYAYDSLFRFMNSLNDFGIPKMKIDSITETKYEGRQDDEATLNLLFKVPNDTPKYTAHVSVENDGQNRKPKVLFVGDSFIFAFEYMPAKTKLISYYENWFYYNRAYRGFAKKEDKVSNINRLRSILNADFIVVYSVGYQWYDGTRGFVEDALESIKDPQQVKVSLLMNEIEKDPEKMKVIEANAKNENISVEKMLELEAKSIIGSQNDEK